MRRNTWTGLALCAVLAGSKQAAAETRHVPAIDVLMLDAVGVPMPTLKQAQQNVMRLYKTVGINLTWVEGELLTSRFLTIHIATQPIGQASNNPYVLGLAASTKDAMGAIAWVFYDRVQAQSRNLELDLPLLLGYVIAHELGHLLLRYASHSVEGVMKADWDKRQVRLASCGQLTFTSDQAALMRAAIQASASPIAHAR